MGMGGATGTGRGTSLADVVADAAEKFKFRKYVAEFQHPACPKKTAYEIALPNGVLYVDGTPGSVKSDWLYMLPPGTTLVHAAYYDLEFASDDAAREGMDNALKIKGIKAHQVSGDNWTTFYDEMVFPFIEARIQGPFHSQTLVKFIETSEEVRKLREKYLFGLGKLSRK